MTMLVRATDLIQRPVVTLAGEDVAQIKDVVYAAGSGQVVGFSLAGRGLLAGPLKQALAWESVSAVGPDAVIIQSGDRMVDRDTVVARSDARKRDVLGDDVLTTDGTALGTVVDVILELGGTADVVGYAIRTADALPPAGRTVFLPLPDTLAVSGEALLVPSTARDFVVDDLIGFGAAVTSFRARLAGDTDQGGVR